jgi:hypothetical protein
MPSWPICRTLGLPTGRQRHSARPVCHRRTSAWRSVNHHRDAVIVFAEDTAVVEIEKALAKADRIVSQAVDKQLAQEIDREAAAAKDAVASA